MSNIKIKTEKQICFGTSGHRGIIGESMTNEHVLAIGLAVADLFCGQSGVTLAVGYDPREGNSPTLKEGSFTKTLCDALMAQGIGVHFFKSYAPTPVVSWYIAKHQLQGGFILTASHNPGIYNGIKFNPSNGAPAPADITKQIEDKANYYFGRFSGVDFSDHPKGVIHFVSCEEAFSKDLIAQLQKYLQKDFLNLSDMSVVIDAKHGTVGAVWQTLLSQLGITHYNILHDKPLSDFGGIEPNPTKLAGLGELQAKQTALQAPLAVANDPDGDRHVILDENGNLLTPEEVTVIIFDYLYALGLPLAGIASTVASSGILKKVALLNGVQYAETAVGFKNFAPFLEECRQKNQIGLAVESSGGFTCSFHTLEKCGFLPGVLLLFIMKSSGKTLSQLKQDIQAKYGRFYFLEEEFHFSEDKKEAILQFFKDSILGTLSNLCRFTIKELVKVDGLKLVFEGGGWILIRLSGTEPLARIYAESSSLELTKDYIAVAKKIIESI